MPNPELEVAYSPCPNDALIFCAWANQFLPNAPIIKPILADVQQLNVWALEGRYPVSKVSFGCLSRLLDQYVLLPAGAALGHNCGPKVISAQLCDIEDLEGKRVAIPGRDTTANLLLECLIDVTIEPHYCTYDQVMPLLKSGAVDAGVIIHESRFTFAKAGFHEVVDLGVLWEKKTSLPLPLGCIVAKRDLGKEMWETITLQIQNSLTFGWENPELCAPYILQHSQEMENSVIEKHIQLYVNQETYLLSDNGIKAVETLLQMEWETLR